MTRVQAYLDATTHELLRDCAEKNDCSFSHAEAKSLLLNLMGEERESKNRLENKQQFLRLMNVLNQVLMCVYDSKKVTIESESAKECLEKIKQSVMESVKD
ncbi:hypothetical protein [Coxiella burnetii]|uniref:hypothetical protein n=1 Tax=Coxiella burnetii TaxID=777 RepID=UPI000183D19C|nr:hypothetical protein [Coxiella burnetii]ACJ21262.1 hypothetical protein CbuK_A0029 [Coxiella burnetii CbuK_Q154]